MDRDAQLAPLGVQRLRVLDCLGGNNRWAQGYFQPDAGAGDDAPPIVEVSGQEGGEIAGRAAARHLREILNLLAEIRTRRDPL